MGYAAFAITDQRTSPRRKLSGLLPGKMTIASSDKALSCKPIDVSIHGLGMISPDLLAVGDQLILTTHDQAIAFKVAWAKPDFGKRDLYRYGLASTDQSVNVEAIFAATGCLK